MFAIRVNRRPATPGYFGRCLPLLLGALPALAAPVAGPPAVIRGIVVRQDGRPVAGARILLARPAFNPADRERWERFRATSDEQGRFQLPDFPERSRGGATWFAALAPGLAVGSDRVLLDKNDLRMVLTEETRLPVRVLDTQGHGVANVHLYLDGGSVPYPPPGRDQAPNALSLSYGSLVTSELANPTDPDGRTVIRGLPRGGQVTLSVRDARWTDTERFPLNRPVRLSNGDTSPEHVIRVVPAASVAGAVHTDHGRPIAGRVVTLQSDTGPRQAVTDELGRFRIDGLGAGTIQISVSSPPDADWLTPERAVVTLATGEQREGFELVCPTGSVVSGRLVIDGTNAGVAGARVGFIIPGDDVVRYGGETAADGGFHFRVPSGKWRLLLDAPDRYLEAGRVGPEGPPVSLLDLKDGVDRELGPLRLRLTPARFIRGRVLTPDGTPAAGAKVYYPGEGATPTLLDWTPRVTTDGNGSFTIGPLHSGEQTACHLRAALGDYSTRQDRVVWIKAGSEQVILKLAHQPLAHVRGRVIDQHGNPVPNARLSPDKWVTLGPESSPPLPATRTNGVYEMVLWPGLRYVLSAGAERHAYGDSVPLRPRPGANPPLPPIMLRKAESFLDFRVLDEQGRALRDTEIEVENPQGYPFLFQTYRRTDATGRVYVLDVLPGRYDVKVLVDGAWRDLPAVRAGVVTTLRPRQRP